MFRKILIANRGEIACRVIDTARNLGVITVAVYSEADRGARHVAMADQAVFIGGAAPSESYLRGDAILEAALSTGAQAVHPGYGFLSENPDFVEALEAAGLIFIGPSAKAIRAMGLKDAAKRLMAKAGVPVVPGYHGPDQSDLHLEEQAGAIGFPILIKAVAGGGGKGMRVVQDASAFNDALQSARGEAKTAFGNDDVLIEKYIEQPRHIEFQIFGDGRKAIHLFERDCSLQRRHQKVIEEAPAPGMTNTMREAMGEAAVCAAEAIGYKGAGTVEFIVDAADGLRSDGFWFMEMNTRLQVEHPVTEAITGVDLVEWQLRVASGEPLPIAQDSLVINGHAFEARLYAEDVPKGFLPATGHLGHLEFPHNIRVDSGVRRGDDITPHYDPMIAKLTSHGPTRAIALQRLSAALSKTEVAGTTTNLAFLGALAEHSGFASGRVDTGLIARDLDSLTPALNPDPSDCASAVMAAFDLFENTDMLTGFHLWAPLTRSISLIFEGVEFGATLRSLSPNSHTIFVQGQLVEVNRIDGHWWINEQPAPNVVNQSGCITVFRQYGIVFEFVDPLQRASSVDTHAGLIEAPMPGLVKAIYAHAGQTVAQGDRLAVLEAMKMEHTLTASRDGVVEEVLVSPGQQVEAGLPLVRLMEEETT